MNNGFLHWWQHLPEHLDPVIFQIGSFRLQYYGLMYLIAFGLTYFLVVYRIHREDRFDISVEQVKDLTTFMILGLIVGARLGYVVFYNFYYYLHHPLEIVLPFEFSDGFRFTGISGMSYHGGLIGCILAAWIYIRRTGLDFRSIVDLYIPVIPLGYTFGRIGNFINGELYGRITTLPIGMYFPAAPGNRLRHPSQLYEAFFEGIFLFAILFSCRKKCVRPSGIMLAYYLIGYGIVRFFIEFTRQPDVQLGFVFLSFSMGQILCAGMIAAGILLIFYLRAKESPSR